MAKMKVVKGIVYRISIEMSCGCAKTGDYKDNKYMESLGEPMFTPCEEHQTDPSFLKALEFFIGEYYDTALEEAAKAPTAISPNLDETGELITRTPIDKPKARVAKATTVPAPLDPVAAAALDQELSGNTPTPGADVFGKEDVEGEDDNVLDKWMASFDKEDHSR